MLFGYFTGPAVVDALVYGQYTSARPTTAAAVRDHLRGDIRTSAQQLAVVALRTLSPTDPKNARLLLRLHKRLTAYERRSECSHQYADFSGCVRVLDEVVQRMATVEQLGWPACLAPELAGCEALGLPQYMESQGLT
jgi:hypothetical protein